VLVPLVAVIVDQRGRALAAVGLVVGERRLDRDERRELRRGDD
jgi:hypothetical protein